MARNQSDLVDIASTSTSPKSTGRRRRADVAKRFLCCFGHGCAGKVEGRPPALRSRKHLKYVITTSQEELHNHAAEEALSPDSLGQLYIHGFSTDCPLEELSPRRRQRVGRSVTSVCNHEKPNPKTKLAPLLSLPLQRFMNRGCRTSICSNTDEAIKYNSEGEPLSPPLINLIPPTPSDVIDDDQFFDISSEEETASHTSGSECADSPASRAATAVGGSRGGRREHVLDSAYVMSGSSGPEDRDTQVIHCGTIGNKSDNTTIKLESCQGKDYLQESDSLSKKTEHKTKSEAAHITLGLTSSQLNDVKVPTDRHNLETILSQRASAKHGMPVFFILMYDG
ncbi:hypothetical protein NDU88_009362 [Pleurodeles waltl]|uniref:Uncharacterized protein n=1 Tax=Pleurodeles waltl TaxID=8319 RepID=A0AAV7RV05_PLEWA|nr:hypothetical protein NDU88_009362 [Pleurodeles waltl]